MARTRQERIKLLIIAGLSVLSLFAFGRTLSKMAEPGSGGLDIFAIWHSGHALRQGEDPLRFALDKREPDLPVEYLDGVVTTQHPVGPQGLSKFPSNTAPVYVPLAALAYLSWPTAKWLWFVMNVGLMVLVPYLVIKLFPLGQRLSSMDKLIIFLLFFSITGTRVVAWLGQTTFLVFGLMLGSLLLRERHPAWSGILLGFALSKYSLAIAVVLFLIWEWRRRNLLILGLAAAVQALGVLILSWMSHVTPWTIVADYLDTFLVFIDIPQGLRLGTLFPDSSFFDIAVPVVLSAGVLGLLTWLRRRETWQGSAWKFAGFETFVTLVLWSLLVAYHRIYDYSTAIIAAPLGLTLFNQPETWRLSSGQRNVVLALFVVCFAILMMPGQIVWVFLPPNLAESWLWLFDHLLVLSIVALLGAAMWLLTRPHHVAERENVDEINKEPILAANQ